MKAKRNLFTGIVLTIALLAGCSSYAQDWTGWRGQDRDGQVHGFRAPAAWPAALQESWSVNVGFSDASPALSGNKLFVFTRVDSSEVVRCLEASSGKELWRDSYQAMAVTGGARPHPGPRATPLVAEGSVVTFGVGGVLSCYDAESGKLLWRKGNSEGLVPVFFTGMSPLFVDGKLIVFMGGPDKGELAALELKTGKVIWRWAGEGPSYGSPVRIRVAGSDQLVVPTEKNYTGLSLTDGKMLWQIPLKFASKYHYNSITPIVNGESFIGTGQGYGTQSYRIFKSGNEFSTRLAWTNDSVGTRYNTPVLRNGLLYGLSDKRKLYCMSADDGKLMWMDSSNHHEFGTTMVAGDIAFALSASSTLVVYKATENGYSEIARYKVSDGPIFASPIVSGSRIFIKEAEKLVMYDLK